MLIIYHGEDIAKSRRALHEALEKLRAKSPNAEMLHLDGAKLTETELVNALEAQSMFTLSNVEGISDDRIIHIDGLLSRRPSKEKEELLEKLYYNQSDRSDYNPFLSLFLWETKQITPSALKKFQGLKDCKIQEFKLGKTLFAFLDSLAPKNTAKMTTLLASTVQTEPPELVMFMLVRRVSELLLSKSEKGDGLSGIRMPWQRSQLERQAKNWTEKELLLFHKKLLDIDESIKTGTTTSDAATHLDILLATL